jgi:hypothetical protein
MTPSEENLGRNSPGALQIKHFPNNFDEHFVVGVGVLTHIANNTHDKHVELLIQVLGFHVIEHGMLHQEIGALSRKAVNEIKV